VVADFRATSTHRDDQCMRIELKCVAVGVIFISLLLFPQLICIGHGLGLGAGTGSYQSPYMHILMHGNTPAFTFLHVSLPLPASVYGSKSFL
jgi:hypothetical protein